MKRIYCRPETEVHHIRPFLMEQMSMNTYTHTDYSVNEVDVLGKEENTEMIYHYSLWDE